MKTIKPEINNKEVEKFIHKARADNTQPKGKSGRPSKEEKRNKGLMVYFTEDEKTQVTEHLNKKKINSFSNYINMLLAEKGII